MAKGNRPVYIAKAKQDADNEYMKDIGCAFRFNKGEGLVVRLDFIPTRWDGSFILVPPLPKDGEPGQ